MLWAWSGDSSKKNAYWLFSHNSPQRQQLRIKLISDWYVCATKEIISDLTKTFLIFFGFAFSRTVWYRVIECVFSATCLFCILRDIKLDPSLIINDVGKVLWNFLWLQKEVLHTKKSINKFGMRLIKRTNERATEQIGEHNRPVRWAHMSTWYIARTRILCSQVRNVHKFSCFQKVFLLLIIFGFT